MSGNNAGSDDSAMAGFPNDGDPFNDTPPEPTPAPVTPTTPDPDPNADLRARMDRLEQENQDLRRLIPPATAKTTPTDPVDPIDAIDWDKELFASPKDAIKKAITIATERTETRLRAEYNRDRGTKEFWERFYGLHPDLREDHDLVESTLNKNIADLANIRVEAAYEKLAGLTRDRILRYVGNVGKSKPKARAEGGSGAPVPKAPTPPVDEGKGHTSLSQLLRARRVKRRAGAA